MEPWLGSQADPGAEFIVTWGIRAFLGIMVFLLFYGATHRSRPAPPQNDKSEDD